MAAAADPYLRYSLDVEQPEADEAQTMQGLTDTMRSISETTLAHGGHAIRSVHAKSHGFVEGEMEIVAGLPAELAQGLFAEAGRYPVVMRFSTIPGDLLADSVSTPRGVAIKVIGVPGERLDGAEGATQDFVLVNGPAFAAPTPKKFLSTLKLLAKTTDKAEGLKSALSTVFRGVQKAVVAVTGSPSPTVATLGGQPATDILGETFYSQAPIRFGDFIAKISVAPASAELAARTDAPVDVSGSPDAIRDAVSHFFRRNGGVWELRAQLCADLEAMPIEDASIVWPEDRSPYRTIARITAKPQATWSEARRAAVDDGMAFSPWHGIAAHRPLGGVMRARRMAYEMGKRFRAEKNGRAIVEPTTFQPLP